MMNTDKSLQKPAFKTDLQVYRGKWTTRGVVLGSRWHVCLFHFLNTITVCAMGFVGPCTSFLMMCKWFSYANALRGFSNDPKCSTWSGTRDCMTMTTSSSMTVFCDDVRVIIQKTRIRRRIWIGKTIGSLPWLFDWLIDLYFALTVNVDRRRYDIVIRTTWLQVGTNLPFIS